MPTFKGTAGNDSWTIINPGNYIIDGLGGIDTLNLGTSLRSSYTIKLNENGDVQIDTLSNASGGGTFSATLINFERLVFGSGSDVIDLSTFFIDTTPPAVLAYSPVQNGTDVSVGQNLVIFFNEPIKKGVGTVSIKSTDGLTFASYDIATTSNVTIAGTMLTINPSTDLNSGKTYTVEFSLGSVVDLKNNAYVATENFRFSTVGASSNTITGTAGNDNLKGTSGNDIINAEAGNDIITASAGNDIINGGSGLDTLKLTGIKSEYIIAASGSNFTVNDKLNRDGNDTLQQVERIVFSNGAALALDIDGVAGQAYRLYQAAFDRKPDLAGLGYWIKDMDNGSSLTVVAAGFFQSPEFQKLYGTNPDVNTLITNFYKNVLHRLPDQAGFDYWAKELNEGKITQAGVLASFCESVENKAQVIGVIENGIDYTPWL